MSKKFLSILSLIIFTTCGIYAQLSTKRVLTLEVAKIMAKAAAEEAVKNKLNVVIAIVDDGANLIYLERMDQAQIGSIDIAIAKAKTAISFKRPTKSYQERVQGGTNFLLAIPSIMPVEGGLPIVVDEQFIGAIGVSGGTPEQDGIVAKAGVDALLNARNK